MLIACFKGLEGVIENENGQMKDIIAMCLMEEKRNVQESQVL